MISPAGTFDYQVVVFPYPNGDFEGRAISLQERGGAASGFIGSTPTVRVEGDQVRIFAHRCQFRNVWWQWFLLPIVPLYLYWERRRASGTNVAIETPGLAGLLASGHVLRMAFDNNKRAHQNYRPDLADVSLFENERLLRKWDDLPMTCDQIPV